MSADIFKALGSLSSPLGILALLIYLAAYMAITFFKQAALLVRGIVFALIVVGTFTYGYAVLHHGQTPATTTVLPSSVVTRLTPPTSPAQLILPDSSARRLTDADLAGLSPADLRIARNEIFARHGYVFRTADMREHFANFTWYAAKAKASEIVLSPIEAGNVSLIQQKEASAASGRS